MVGYIYADNAATTKLDIDAFEAMKPYLLDEYGNASQPYSFSRKVKEALRNSREIIAECIGANPEEIFFTSGGTESDNWAIKSFASRAPERIVITSEIEHHAILNTCKSLLNQVYYLPVDEKGIVTSDVLIKQLECLQRTRSDEINALVSIMFANNEIGSIEPIEELSKIAHSYGAIFHTDAVQAVGHTHIDVSQMGIDMLSASAHKFNGPKGIGFLYIKSGIPICPFINGGAQEYGLRAGTENVASIVGMAAALSKNCKSMKVSQDRINDIEGAFLKKLNDCGIDYIRNGSANHLPGNISLSIREQDGETLLHRLDLKKIAVSTGSACDSTKTQISHVLEAIHCDDNYANGTIRISFGKDNTLEEAEYIANQISKIVNGGR